MALAEPVADEVPEADALEEPLGDAVAVTVDEAVPEALEEPVAVAVPISAFLPSHISVALLHLNPAAHSGSASMLVHEGPNATALGRHAPPHAAGASTVAAAREANVNAARGMHRAAVAPWQESDPESHPRPVAQSVAASGPV